jgi:16S rRNA (uracil1498-N3)-methyltransferase
MSDDLYKYPRLYMDHPLAPGDVTLCAQHAHYLRNVMRRADGETVRFFNGVDGEWRATLVFGGRRDVIARLEKQVKPQTPRTRRVHLFFAPLKKDRMDVLISAAVQLDATDLHPVITERTEVREIKDDKVKLQIIEAAEQCERMDLPVLHPVLPLDRALSHPAVPVFAGLERSDAKPLRDALVPAGDCACLVGPVGGWTDREREYLNNSPNITPVTLGPNVLRSETAVAAMLTRLASSRSL